MHFSSSNITANVSVLLQNNSVPEDAEKFSLNLALVMNVGNIIFNNVILVPSMMEITILDDDRKLTKKLCMSYFTTAFIRNLL